MKYWRKYLKDKMARIKKSIELFAETGHCGGLPCYNCPFAKGDCCNTPDTKEEIVAALNMEVAE